MKRVRRRLVKRFSNAVVIETQRLNDQALSELRAIVEACSKETAILKLRVDDLTLKLREKTG